MPAPYVLSNLLPVILVSLVVLSVFFLPSDALADRLSELCVALRRQRHVGNVSHVTCTPAVPIHQLQSFACGAAHGMPSLRMAT